MAYIDDTYIENAIGEAEHDALYTDAGVLNTAARTQNIASADKAVADALAQAGYAAPSGATNVTVNDASLGVYVVRSYGRKGIPVPEQFKDAIAIVNAIANGDRPVSGLDPSAIGAVGGSVFSESSSSVTPNRAPIFTRDNLGF